MGRFRLNTTWRGKAIGATIGVFAGGPVGAAIGALLGHFYDQSAQEATAASQPVALPVQEVFFRATFQLMGHIAKADGLITEEEIRAARAMMAELRLGEAETRFAIDLYREGKEPEFAAENVVRALNEVCVDRPDLKRMFVQIQLHTALKAGAVSRSTRTVITRVCDWLDVSTFELLQMEALLRMQQRSPEVRAGDRERQAYDVLGLTSAASDAEVTKAYRRLMNENHPDKLVARGLPESMMKLAEEKTKQIRSAYELLRAARGIR